MDSDPINKEEIELLNQASERSIKEPSDPSETPEESKDHTDTLPTKLKNPSIKAYLKDLAFIHSCCNISPAMNSFIILDNNYNNKICANCLDTCYGDLDIKRITSVSYTKGICDCFKRNHEEFNEEEQEEEENQTCKYKTRFFQSDLNNYCSICNSNDQFGWSDGVGVVTENPSECNCENNDAPFVFNILKLNAKAKMLDLMNFPMIVYELFSNHKPIYKFELSDLTPETLKLTDNKTNTFWFDLARMTLINRNLFKLSFNALKEYFKLDSLVSLDTLLALTEIKSSPLAKETDVYSMFDIVNLLIFEAEELIPLYFDNIRHFSPSTRQNLFELFRNRVKLNYKAKNTAGDVDEKLISIFNILLEFEGEAVKRSLYYILVLLEDSNALKLMQTLSRVANSSFFTFKENSQIRNIKSVYKLAYLRYLDIFELNSKVMSAKEISEIEILLLSGAISISKHQTEDSLYASLIEIDDYHSKSRPASEFCFCEEEENILGEVINLKIFHTKKIKNQIFTLDYLKACSSRLNNIFALIGIEDELNYDIKDFIDLDTSEYLAFTKKKRKTIVSKEYARLCLTTNFIKILLEQYLYVLSDKCTYSKDFEEIKKMKVRVRQQISSVLECLSYDNYETAIYIHQELARIASEIAVDDEFQLFYLKIFKIVKKMNPAIGKYLPEFLISPSNKADMNSALSLYYKRSDKEVLLFIHYCTQSISTLLAKAEAENISFREVLENRLDGSEADFYGVNESQFLVDMHFQIRKKTLRTVTISALYLFVNFFSLKFTYNEYFKLADRSFYCVTPVPEPKIPVSVFNYLLKAQKIPNVMKLKFCEYFCMFYLTNYFKRCNFSILVQTFELPQFSAQIFQQVTIDNVSASEEEYSFNLKVHNILEFDHIKMIDQLFTIASKVIGTDQPVSKLVKTLINLNSIFRSFVCNTRSLRRNFVKVLLVDRIRQFIGFYSQIVECILNSDRLTDTYDEETLFIDDFEPLRNIQHKSDRLSRLNVNELNNRLNGDKVALTVYSYSDFNEILNIYFNHSSYRPVPLSSDKFESVMPVEFSTTELVYNRVELLSALVNELISAIFEESTTYYRVIKILEELISIANLSGKEGTNALFQKIKDKLSYLVNKTYFLILDYIRYIEIDYYAKTNAIVHKLIIRLLTLFRMLNNYNNTEAKEFFWEIDIEYTITLVLFKSEHSSTDLEPKAVNCLRMFSAVADSITNYILSKDSLILSEEAKRSLASIVQFSLELVSEVLEGNEKERIKKAFSTVLALKALKEQKISKAKNYLCLFRAEDLGPTEQILRVSYVKFIVGVASEIRISTGDIKTIYTCITPESIIELMSYVFKNLLKSTLNRENVVSVQAFMEFKRHFYRDIELKIFKSDEFELLSLLFNYILRLKEQGISKAIKIVEIADTMGLEKEPSIELMALKFVAEVTRSVEVSIDDELKVKYFPLSPLSDNILSTSKKEFFEKIDRTDETSKKMNLMQFSQLYNLEISLITNKTRHFPLIRYLNKIDFLYCSALVYLSSLIVNILLLFNLHRGEEGVTVDNESMFVYFGIGQIILCLILLLIWGLVKFDVTFEKNKLLYRLTNKGSEKDIPLQRRLRIAVFNTILLDSAAQLFLSTALGALLGIVLENKWIFSLQLLLLTSLSENLLNIVTALVARVKQLFLIIVFILIIIFVYSNLTFFYLQSDFQIGEFSEDFDMCTTLPHCFASQFDYGMRMGGGIGDSMNIINWQEKDYWTRFGLSFTFYLVVILVLLNVMSGIIIDTFSDLRERQAALDYDKRNICVICQNSKTKITQQEGSYGIHVDKIHNIYSYMAYISYIQGLEANKHDEVDGFVLESIKRNDIGWFPSSEEDDLDSSVEEEEESDYDDYDDYDSYEEEEEAEEEEQANSVSEAEEDLNSGEKLEITEYLKRDYRFEFRCKQTRIKAKQPNWCKRRVFWFAAGQAAI